MTRYTIGIESGEPINNTVIVEGALRWEDKPYTVTNRSHAFHDVPEILGHATDIRREADGKITAKIDYEIPYGLGATIYANQLECSKDAEMAMVVHKARMRGVFLTPDVPWAEKAPMNEDKIDAMAYMKRSLAKMMDEELARAEAYKISKANRESGRNIIRGEN